jgi:hypothetical protein
VTRPGGSSTRVALAAAITALITAPIAAQEPTELLWFWMEDCGGPQIRLELEFDGSVVRETTLPICQRSRASEPPDQARMLVIRFAPTRQVAWSGYKEEPETSPANEILEFQVWQAGADPNCAIFGLSVSANHNLYMNTLLLALPDRPFESTLANGLVLRTVPEPSRADE